MRRFAPPVPRRWSLFACLTLVLAWVTTSAAQQFPRPITDPNVNMVKGITWPDGDPYLQRQNEPSIAISTRNPCHLVAGANDYRSVDLPFDDTEPPNTENNVSLAGDAWLGLFKSTDCGNKWQSTLLPGYPQDTSGKALGLKGYAAGADPTVRAAHNGLFYYSGMVFNRGDQGNSKIFVARLIDNNNKERGDPIEFLDVATIDTGTKGQFLDKPWLAVDVPRNGFGPGSTLATGGTSSTGTCDINGQRVAAGNVYMAWARFTGESSEHSKLMFARSEDCGQTWKANPISNNQTISQGANIAVAPHDGTIYLTWREFASTTGNGGTKPVNFWVAVSSDGGKTFSSPRMIASNITTFDQLRSTTTFRSNALPAITADHQDRVYIAWSARGYAASCTTPNGTVTDLTGEARIVMTVSSDRGNTFGPIVPIDPSPACGHQMMPSLAFAAGKIQAIWYDAREDAARVFRRYVDDQDVNGLRHTIDVRGAQADPAPAPVFVAANGASLEISKYRQWQTSPPDNRQSIEVGANPPNLAMYAQGTTPFIGDYIDVSALPAFPVQTSGGQVWQPNIGPLNMLGAGASNISTSGFPTLPIFHAAWTDNRDVKIAAQCVADPNTGEIVPQQVGQRNANIYTARLTPGLFVGSTGNTKPLGYRIDPATGQSTGELIQRGFVVFAQNTTDTLRFFSFQIANQPAGGRATFQQFASPEAPPRTSLILAIPRKSTAAKTVYAISTDPVAQILVNVQEVTPVEIPCADGEVNDLRKCYQWPPRADGLRGSVLLNPDRTNPAILEPDVDSEVPQIATDEVHDPSMFEAQFFRHTSKSRKLDVRNPDPENPDPENPDPENPDPENPDPENPDPENPDPENPDPENPDPENPDPENPDPENPDPENADLENTAISDEELQSATITDINWRVHNSGNTTSAYNFRPSLPRKFQDQKYQLIVTRRSMALALDPSTCQPIYKSANQVLVNIINYEPKTPDPENPDPENPDPENPDPENPDPENPDPENPDPENPDPENANFFLAPDETATVTLRVFDLDPTDAEPAPTTENDVAGKTAAQAANTGETEVTTAVAGPDLTLFDTPFIVEPPIIRSGATVNVTWTLTNRGTANAISPSGTIKTNVYFSNDAVLDVTDVKIGETILEPTPFAYCADAVADAACSTTTTTPVVMPQAPGQYYVIVVTDDDNDSDDPAGEVADPDREVFEADELNNVLVVPVRVDAYQLTFVQQPSPATQDFTIAPPVMVAVTHPDGGLVTPAAVPFVTLAIQTNPGNPAGVLSGTAVQPNVNGVATFADLRIDRAANGYTLSASAVFSTGATSAPFNILEDLPPVVAGDSYTVGEDQALNVPAPGVLTNDSDPPTQGIRPAAYAFTAVVETGPANGVLNLNADGALSYTPNAAFNGVDTFTYRARDGRPGNETTGTVTITVTPVNDAPSFTQGADQTVAEDSGPQTVPNWATNISPGANEAGQTVAFLADNNSNSLFSVQPAILPNGTLTYTPAANTSGSATVTVRLRDDGGTANGGVDTSAPATFVITVTAATDAPVAAPDSYTTSEDTPLGVDASGIGGIQGLLFNDTDADPGTVLVAEYLSTTTNGTLLPHQNGSFSYTPNPHFFGTDSFTYRAIDNQNNASNTVTVTITVLSVNDAPSFTRGPNQTAPTGLLPQTVPGWATAISAGPANESAQVVDFIVANDNPALFNTQPAISPNGTLTFTPKQNAEGTATVTVRVHDNGGTANGGVDTSAPQTFTITITSAIQTYIVTNTNDSGNGSLRAAILSANANASQDIIRFDISGGGVKTITPLTPLPALVFPVIVDGITQPGYTGTPLVELNGSTAGAGANGLTVNASNVTIRGFVINRFQGAGVSLAGANNVVAGNYIGTNAAGTAAQPNQVGIVVTGPSSVLIGGIGVAARNVISGNTTYGISVIGPTGTPAPGTLVQGNLIGLDAAGANIIANGNAGIQVASAAVEIGGAVAGARNVISGHSIGVNLSNAGSTFDSVIAGNYFGTDVTGMIARGNSTAVAIGSAPGTRVGGEAPGAGNRFAGNSVGVAIAAISQPVIDGLYNAVIQGNVFGMNAAGGALPNGTAITTSNSDNLIGGAAAAAANVIAYNTGVGVSVAAAGARNRIMANAIHSNGGLGIDLGGDGVTANDAGDADGGANSLQNYPVLTLAHASGGATSVTGSLNTTPNTAFRIEFFSNTAADPGGHGEGQLFIGAQTVTTDGTGSAAISAALPAVAPGGFITATATDPAGNTSEFSAARIVIANLPPTATDDTALVVAGNDLTFYPSNNDIDPDVAAPALLATWNGVAPGGPQLLFPGDVAVVNATGLAYFTGNNVSAATAGKVGILDTTTGAIIGTLMLPQPAGGSTLVRVNQTTQIVYMRAAGSLQAIDGRSGSATFNQAILSLSLGTIQSMALDETRGRLYMTVLSAGAGTIGQGRLVVLDVNPASATFHQVVGESVPPGTATSSPSVSGVGVNPVTNRVFVAVVGGSAPGVVALDGTTLAATVVANTAGASTLAVNPANNMVYAIQGANLFAIDGATSQRIASITLPATATGGVIDTRLAIHEGTGRVFVRLAEFPAGSRLVVVDGDRNSPTFNTILTSLSLGREQSNTMVAVDESANRVVTTSRADLETTVIDAATLAVVGTVTSTQPMARLTIDSVHHRAYVSSGVGQIQSIDLLTGTQQAIIPTGVEVVGVAVSTDSHSAYVTQTGVTTAVRRIDHTGVIGSVPLPHGDGREVFILRNGVTNRLYAVNAAATAAGGDDALPGFVHVIDGTSNTVIASVPVGPSPFQGMAINEVTNRIYVGSSASGAAYPASITVIDGATHASVQADLSQIPQTSAIAGQLSFARDFVVNAITNKVYVRITGGSPSQVAVLDGVTNVVTALPNVFGVVDALRVNPVLNRVYISSTLGTGEHMFYVLDGSTHEVLTSFEGGSVSTFSAQQNTMAVNRVTGRLYVVDFEDDVLGAIEGATNAVAGVVPVGDGPSAVAVNETLNRVYVGNSYDRTLTIVDGATLRVVGQVALPLPPLRIEVDETTARVFVLASTAEPGVMVVSDPGTSAPTVTAVTQAAHGTVVLNDDGSVTYTSNGTHTGSDSYTYTVTDGQGGTSTATVTVNVRPALQITPASLPASTVGSSYAQTITAAGGTGTKAFLLASGGLPGGLFLNSTTGQLSGTARQSGTFAFTVLVRDSDVPPQQATRAYSITVGPPVITTTFLANAEVNQPYSQTVIVGGATGAVSWSLNTNNNPLLSWLSILPDGTLTGTPPVTGLTPSFTVTATDSLDQVAVRSYTLTVNGPLDVLPLREGIVLETQPSFSFVGGSGTRTVTQTAGSLPPGLTLASNGLFSGTPTRHGTYNFTVELRDCEPNPGSLQPTCTNQVTPQLVTKDITLRVSAKEQQGSSQTQSAIGFGGPGGRRLAQVVTVGAQGTLTAIGLQNFSCPAVTPVLIEVQRLTLAGLPDGNTISDGVATANYNAIAITPPFPMAIDEKFAFIVSSPVACTFTNAATTDQYQGGDAYVDAGAGWQTLFSTDGRYDLPSFRTLIQPAMDVIYTQRARGAHTTTLLADGRVLIAGNNTAAEIYDPATNLTTLTGNLANGSRTNHASTLLDDGRVLITGGRINGVRNATAEIFDPVTGQFSAVASMSIAREWHQAVRLNDGRVLVIGGQYDSTPLTSLQTPTTEIFDPATQSFTPSGSMSVGRERFFAALLQSGQVLVGGGYLTGSGASAETYDPGTGLFTATGSMVLNSRGWATATRLADGRVLIAGGNVNDPRAAAEIYDPATNAFSATGSMARPRYIHSAALLADGSVLVAGGYDESSSNYIHPVATLERYLPGSGTWVPAGSMETRRQSFAALALPNGNVLLSGGFSQSWMTGNTAELYDPAAALSISPSVLAHAPLNTAYAPVTFTGDGGDGGPYTITLVSGVLPPGMTYTPATRTLSGTPTVTGVFPLGLEVADGSGHAVVQTLTLGVGDLNVITSPYRLVDGAIGASYSVQLAASGAPPITWSLAPAQANLPPGLSLDSTGAITGTPTTTAFYAFTVRALDSTGQLATKVHAISIRAPLSITTTSLGNVDLFSGGPGCISTANANGTRTFSITAGALPAGLVLTGTNSCITGTVRETGTFTFTVQVTDQSSPPQVATREFTINSWAMDQNNGYSLNEPDLTFGGATNRRLGQRVITGITGTLRAIRLVGLTCPAGTIVTAAVQGMTPAGAPDGVTLTSGTGVAPFGTIVLGGGEFFAADAEFALLFDADQTCAVKPLAFDSYPGTGFESTSGADWVTLQSFNGRHDVPFVTLIEPEAGIVPLWNYRGTHTQTLLGNGLVLVAGGAGNVPAELFNPATSTTAQIASPMTASRSNHTATRLDDGRVLLAGGNNLATAEVYDPALNTFTAVGSMASVRSGHTATLLDNGQVLVAGGYSGTEYLQTAELFDPGSGTFQPLPNMLSQRSEHTATLLPDGRVLLAAGYGAGSSSELYDPDTQTFVATDQPMAVPRGRHTATLLTDGTVLITGGTGFSGAAESSAEIFNPAAGPLGNGTFQPTVSGMRLPRLDHTATPLADGSVLIAGGYTDNTCCYPHPPTAAMERYVPGLGSFEGAGSSLVARYAHAATPLTGSSVLLSGTFGWSSAAGRTAEVYDFASRPRFGNTSTGRAESGQPYSFSLFPTGGAGGPYTVAIVSGRLPQGLGFDEGTMTFSGTPTEPGTFPITVSLTDGGATTVYQVLTFRVDTLLITTASTLNTAYQGLPYVGVGLSAQGVGAVTWTIISGSLPAGLGLDGTTGAITGTPTVSCCSYTFSVRATDSVGQTATQSFTIPVQAPLNITTTTLGDGTASETYFGCVTANGGSGNRTWSLSGQYPSGLSILNNGCFDTTYPAQALRQGGTFTFTVQVTDSSVPQQVDTQQFTLRVHAQDQSPSWNFGAIDVPVPASRRLAQVYRSSSPFPLSGVNVFSNLTCDPGVTVTAQVWSVTGSPARPLETVAYASGQVITNQFGYVGMIGFPTPVDMPQGSQFAITFDADGACTVRNWPTSHYYQLGESWVDDGGGWTLGRTALSREDLPFSTLVLPPTAQRFFSAWRGGASVVTLADGRVLIAGPDHTAEIYDPVNNTMTQTGNMSTGRNGATATLLSNNRVLVAGGNVWNGSQTVSHNSTEIFDPLTGTFSAGPSMSEGRYDHAATTLADGRVLISGGRDSTSQSVDSAVLFDAVGANPIELAMTGARARHTATRLNDGRVFILGGWTAAPYPPQVSEIFDPADNSFTAVPAGLPWWPSDHTATTLVTGPNAGQVLIAGGAGFYPQLPTASYLFDPVVIGFTAAPAMLLPRIEHAATRLADGRIAFTGGAVDWVNWITTSQVEIYDPVTDQFALAGQLVTDMASHTAVTTMVGGDEHIVVGGGWGSGVLANKTGDLFDPAAASTALRITTASLPDGQVGQEYNGFGLFFLEAAGCQLYCEWSLAWGNLPPGLFLGIEGELGSNGGLTAGGVYSFVLRVTDSASNTATRAFTITVDRLVITSPATLPQATAGAPYAFQFAATGVGAITYSAFSSPLPGTLTLSASGLLSGTAPGPGSWSISVRATDASGQSTVQYFTLPVVP